MLHIIVHTPSDRSTRFKYSSRGLGGDGWKGLSAPGLWYWMHAEQPASRTDWASEWTNERTRCVCAKGKVSIPQWATWCCTSSTQSAVSARSMRARAQKESYQCEKNLRAALPKASRLLIILTTVGFANKMLSCLRIWIIYYEHIRSFFTFS